MERVRIAGATLNQTPLDWLGNEARLRALLTEARRQGVEVLCLPELCLTGYGCEDMFFSLHTAHSAEAMLRSLLPDTEGMIVLFGLPVFHKGAMYNATVMVQDGLALGINPKKLLPREGVHYEHRWFKPWQFGSVQRTTFLNLELPFGDVRYQFGTMGIAVEICEEAWNANATAADHALSGVELVLNASASHFALGKVKTRETLVANNSRSMQVHYVYANNLGLEAGRIIYDGGVLIAECGTITARGKRFGFHDGELTVRDVDLDRARVGKLCNRSVGSRQDAKEIDTAAIYGKSLTAQRAGDIREKLAAQDVSAPLTPQEEFLEAEMLGLFDYLRKSGSQGYVVSLSGGADSGTIAVLVSHMIASALKELGPDAMAKRLGIAAPSLQSQNPRSWIHQILTLVYQGTAQSGSVTRQAASGLAKALGANYFEVELQEVVDHYLANAGSILGEAVNWQAHDVAMQNIQARARAPMIWLVANLKNAVLLSTSNRSEAAVGYATMDGDTAGGLAPLGGIDKHFIRRWLLWSETTCTRGLGPLPELRAINVQSPTAELRPPSAQQEDEVDLMPYEVLERIERLLIRDRMSPQEIVETLDLEYAKIDRSVICGYVSRFLQLWSQNQWKRERYAPSFHMDEISLDPTTWCRFPILSGGFRKEISEIF